MIVSTSHRVCTMKNIDFTDFFNVFLSGATIGWCIFFGKRRDSNPLKCDMPVAYRNSQFKNWLSPYDFAPRAKSAIECIEAMRDGRNCEEKILLPVELIKRESTRELSCQNL